MLEKKDLILTIFDSDEIDTIDSFVLNTDTQEIEINNEPECQFEKIDLNKFSQEPTKKIVENTISPRELGKLYDNEIKNKKAGILEPSEFLEEIHNLAVRSEETIEKLKCLHSKCSLGIVDLEHKIEFEALSDEEGQEILSILRTVIIYQRHIKDALEKYKSIAQITQTLDKAFTESQFKKLDKVEEFQSSRVYIPRVFNIVEKKNYPTTKISIKTIEHELNQLIEATNSRYEKV